MFKGEVEFEWLSHLWKGEPRLYTARFADDDQLLIWHGDAEGVLHRDAEGRPLKDGFGPLYSLAHDGVGWVVKDGALGGEARDQAQRGGFVLDPRSFGLSERPSFFDPEGTIGRGADHLAGARFSRRVDDEMELVVAESSGGTLKWWCDPRKGGAPVRVVLERDGRILREARSRLRQFDGRWFPEHIEYFNAEHKSGKEPAEIIRVKSARFDSDDLPDRITPQDIGVDAGFNVERYDVAMRHAGGAIWDGQAFASPDEFARRVQAGEIEPGPIFQRNAARLRRLEQARAEAARAQAARAQTGVAVALDGWEAEWERYVREFCDRYKLSQEQRAHADRLLESCRGIGRQYMARQRTALEAFERAAARFSTLSESEQAARRAPLEQQRLRLLLPLQEIFDERLRPALEKLPTREQRRAAEPAPPPGR
ncbi:MAG: outer membrane lipoprotein-sorting protein [Phycisphaerae bacterium]|nr:hypothetical protein [Phycisphaerae bacterium]MCZ2399795.1 outer membrane lipoprotein-sorting protein [Phycisphaerae bacterium]NUQ49016.1 hypothetical protein [Phycisphaerae bacterium]